jgi:hypothetical protein
MYAFDELHLQYVPSPIDRPYYILRTFTVIVFRQILALFKYELANLSIFEPTSQQVERTVEFIVKSLEIYPVEEDGIDQTRPVLQRLLGHRNCILIQPPARFAMIATWHSS